MRLIDRAFQLFFAIMAMSLIVATPIAQAAENSIMPYQWRVTVGGRFCTDERSYTSCHASSPVLADIDGDGLLDVIVGTNDGHLVVVRHDGQQLWDRDTALWFGLHANAQQISASPSVADIDGDGDQEIVVATGSDHPHHCSPGGILVVDHLGQLVWRFDAEDYGTLPEGCADPIFATPALGDLDADGKLEIIVAGTDKRLIALHYDGQMVEGFPVDSHYYPQFGWNNLKGRLADTLHSSPALADIDNDGFLDIVIGTEEGIFPSEKNRKPCPYQKPAGWSVEYCGGSIYAVNRFGKILDRFPIYLLETVTSSPAVVDLNRDGEMEIISGVGSFYHDNSSDRPQDGSRIHVWNTQGEDAIGWENGKATDSPTPASVAVGDIAGDQFPEVVAVSLKGTLYAWHQDGQLVDGFPVQPTDHHQLRGNFDIGTAPILANLDNDGKMEIVLNIGWSTVIVNGQGIMLTANSFPSSSYPIYLSDQLLINSPSVGDMDGDGDLELVTFNDHLTMWQIKGAGSSADWPMFHRDAKRQGSVPTFRKPKLEFALEAINLHHVEQENNQIVERYFAIDVVNAVSYDLVAKVSNALVEVTVTDSTRSPLAKVVRMRIDSSLFATGQKHDLGNLELDVLAKADAESQLVLITKSIPISLEINSANETDPVKVYLPIVLR